MGLDQHWINKIGRCSFLGSPVNAASCANPSLRSGWLKDKASTWVKLDKGKRLLGTTGNLLEA